MLRDEDFQIHELIIREKKRQRNTLCLIPSENFCSVPVLQALGSILNNKYAEGYPKKRYYQGNSVIDKIEELAIQRAKKLFNAEHVNVQPNSGSPANMAVYFALLKPGDTVLAMDLSQGGHLTHGSPVNFSGKLYNFVFYGVDKKTELIDFNQVRKLARQYKPKLIISGFTAYPRTIHFENFYEIAEEVGAYSMADISHIAGLIVSELHPNPLPYFDVVTTTTHKTLRGPRGAIILCKERYAKAIDRAVFPGLQGGPHEHVIAAKAVAFKEAMSESFKEYSQQIIKNAKTLAKTLMKNKIKLVSDGTDNHLMLINVLKTVGKKGLGREYAEALESVGIITNANTIPYDPGTPFKPSGIRLGTPAVTSMGLKEKDMVKIGKFISEILKHPDDLKLRRSIRKDISLISSRHSPQA